MEAEKKNHGQFGASRTRKYYDSWSALEFQTDGRLLAGNFDDDRSSSAYGAEMRLNEVATINAPEPRLLTVQVWDKSNVSAVEKAIHSANLGLNPATDGQLVRVPIPELNEERRRDLVRVAAKYTEQARVAVRNVRRDGMDILKRMERDGELSRDDHQLWADEVQALTDSRIERIDELLAAKEAEIVQV